MSTNNNSTMCFITIDQLKARLGATEIKVIHNEKTGKNFAASSVGINLKVQQNLDPKLDVRYMYETDELFNEGCIVNAMQSAKTLYTF